MSKKDRKPICLHCEFGYPIELVADMKELEYRCPLCGYTISFKDWMFGEGEEKCKNC